jgi:hypothetical protein
MSFDYDINHYTFDDLKKLFNVKQGETVSTEEIDMRISNIQYSAKQTNSNEQYQYIVNFLQIAKEKFGTFVKTQDIQYNNVYPFTERLQQKFLPNKFLDKNEHAVIEQTLDINIPTETKYVNINSSDRDEVAWPLSTHFEIDLPDNLKDVTYLQLFDYNFYNHIFNFTNFYQNTKLSFQVSASVGDNDISGEKLVITLSDGNYNNDDLMTALATALNDAVSKRLTDLENLEITYSNFICSIDDISKKFKIVNTADTFNLYFDAAETYDFNKWQIRNIYDLKTSWGLGYFLGFGKDIYSSSTNATTNYKEIISPFIFTPTLNYNVFLEIDGFNHIFQTRNNTGLVNSYFARIPIKNGFANDVGGFERVEMSSEKVSKIKIRLRFHTGILLDLQGQNYDITFMFGCKK